MDESDKKPVFIKSVVKPTAVIVAFGALAFALSGTANAQTSHLKTSLAVSAANPDVTGSSSDLVGMVTPGTPLAIAAVAVAVLIAHTIQSANPPIDGANGASYNLIDSSDKHGITSSDSTDFDY